MPIFKEFIKVLLKRKTQDLFKVAENITLMVIDPKTGKKAALVLKKL